MNIVKLALLFVISILIIGCASPSLNLGSKSIEYPDWYLNHTKDDSYNFHSTGMGKSEQGAINSALNSIASRLSVEISSTFESETKSSTMDGYRKTSQKNINSRVQKIKFNNYSVIKKASSSNMVFILLKVNKRSLANSIKEDINLKLNEFDMKLSNLRGSNFKKLKVLKTISTNAKNLKTDFIIANTIIRQKNRASMMGKIDSYMNSYLNLKNRITFHIKLLNYSPKEYGDALSNIITQKGYNVTNSPSDYTVTINLKVTEYKIITNGRKIIKAKINLSLKDKNSFIDNFNMDAAGVSRTNYQIARSIAVKMFAKKVKESLNE